VSQWNSLKSYRKKYPPFTLSNIETKINIDLGLNIRSKI